MKLLFKTSTPSELKSEIISFAAGDKSKTWEIHELEGVKYLKHTQQWGSKGVIKLTCDTKNEHLVAEVLKYKSVEGVVSDFEGYYFGRFCELVFVNFPNKISIIEKG